MFNSSRISLIIIFEHISRTHCIIFYIKRFRISTFPMYAFMFLYFAYILRLKQLERNLPVQKWLLQFFVNHNSCSKYILSTAFASLRERRVILPNVRFARHYSVPDICLALLCVPVVFLAWTIFRYNGI